MYGGAFHPEERQEAEEQGELDGEFDQVRDDDRERDAEPGEIDFAEDAGVGQKGGGGAVEALGEIGPCGYSCHVEQHGWYVVGREFGDAAKDEGEQDRGKERLEQVPEGAEDGLLVLGHEIAPDEQRGEVAVAPEVGEVEVEPSGFGADDQGPILGARRWKMGDGGHQVKS